MGKWSHWRRSLCWLFVLSFAGLLACAESQPEYPARQVPEGLLGDQVQRARGHELFMVKCASCHGKSGEGRSGRAAFFEPAAPDFTETLYRELDPAYLYWRIEVGKTVEPYNSQGSVMPAWKMHFSEQQVWQIVAYLRARAH